MLRQEIEQYVDELEAQERSARDKVVHEALAVYTSPSVVPFIRLVSAMRAAERADALRDVASGLGAILRQNPADAPAPDVAAIESALREAIAEQIRRAHENKDAAQQDRQRISNGATIEEPEILQSRVLRATQNAAYGQGIEDCAVAIRYCINRLFSNREVSNDHSDVSGDAQA